MGALCFSLSTLLLIMVTASELLFKGYSITYWEDVKGLKELKKMIDSASVTPGSCLSSWDFSVDPCDHIFSDHFTCGFRCDLVVSGISRVTEVSLDQAGYTGSLSSSACNYLPYLETLNLAENSLSGSMPTSLSNLTRLRRLTLSGNFFSGEIPTLIGSLFALEELYLDHNQLQGPIPASFNGLSNLKRLELQENKLSGEFPDLSNLKNLTFFYASNNAISGGVLVRLPGSLVEISMRNNSLKGNLPEKIGDLGFLQVLDLSHNQLSGAVPSVVFQHPSLQQLTLSHNQLSSIQDPRDGGTTSELVALDLSSNELQGLLPAFMATMPKLSALSLEKNKFTGMIPSQYALRAAIPIEGTSAFARLLLGGNYLFGLIPGPLMAMKPGTANVSLVDNCLYMCPKTFFFCQGGVQKSSMACKIFGLVIPET
ncbi:hypothetical protein NE237_022640 [Protea cynaroides]|uniref:Uncharacterized protein n=1 Tax=Protea cynaroides TaxID=273540 RepID=A0A9Q0K4E3_9MAGN|nr:hypothetical protein NE237_022640 [Protea cynaroides]